jgi:ketosteroid isomerase-like protein
LTDFWTDTTRRSASSFKGDPEPLKALYSHEDDVIIANPFGPPARSWEQAAAVMDRAASHYTDGEATGFDGIVKYVTPGLAYTVEIERYRVRVSRSETIASIALRVTSIFRPEEGAWKVVHRHADQVTSPRGPESLIQE